MKQVLLLILITALSACGGYHQAKRGGGARPAPQPQPQPQTLTAPIAITPTVVGVTTPGVAPGAAPAPAVTVATAPAGVTRPQARGTAQPVATRVATAPAATLRRKPFARGPISKACMASDRKARSRELCGCIQAVADQKLSSSQQKLAVSFYSNPHRAQEIRQSDNASHEAFWKDYKAYGEAAKRSCR